MKHQYHKEDGRQYYHIVQSFSPDDNVTPELAHEIGMKFAENFPGYQVLVATHTNTKSVHNHLIMNSVNFEDGRKFHISRDQMLQYKEISNQLCRQYGLSVTEVKTKKRARWKDELIETLYDALENTTLVLLSGLFVQNLLDYCAEYSFISAVKSYALIAKKVSV